jgi:hypothetical protein
MIKTDTQSTKNIPFDLFVFLPILKLASSLLSHQQENRKKYIDMRKGKARYDVTFTLWIFSAVRLLA